MNSIENLDKVKVIKDPVHGNIQFSFIESLVFSSSIFNRLHNILQNSLAYFVFPSTKTSRFMHSVGVMDVASRMFYYSIQNAKPEVSFKFLNEFYDRVLDLSKNIKAIINDDPALFQLFGGMMETFNKCVGNINGSYELLLMDKGLSDYNISCSIVGTLRRYIKELQGFDNKETEDILRTLRIAYLFALQSLRLAGLLHDAGHLAFSHISEYVLEDILDELKTKKEESGISEIEQQIYDILEIYDTKRDKGLKIHEMITQYVIDCIFYEIMKEYYGKGGRNVHFLCLLIILRELIKEILYPNDESIEPIQALNSILHGDLDADRIDFIIRDGSSSGLLSGTGDIDRIIKLLVLHWDDEEKKYYFVPTFRCLNDLEQLFIDRFIIYKYLVCHHKVIRFDYLLQKAIKLAIENEIKRRSEIDVDKTALGDDILQMIASIKLGKSISLNQVYKISQIDDYWLLSLLRQKYFELLIKSYSGEDLTDNEERLMFILGELFTNSKILKSSWKRDNEYWDFVFKVIETIATNEKYRESILEYLEKILELVKYIPDEEEKLKRQKKRIEDAIHNIRKVLKDEELYKNKYKLKHKLIHRKFDEFLDFILHITDSNWTRLSNWIERELSEPKIFCATVIDKLKTGIEDLKILDTENKLVDFKLVSNTPDYLHNKKLDSMKFIIYYPKDRNRDEVLREIVRIYIEKVIIKKLNECVEKLGKYIKKSEEQMDNPHAQGPSSVFD